MAPGGFKKYETILFDFDNTLVDLKKYWDKYIHEFASKHQIKISDFESFKYRIINKTDENFDDVLAEEFKTENQNPVIKALNVVNKPPEAAIGI